MRIIRYLLVLLLVMGCAKDEPIATNGNIVGRVTDNISNDPVTGAAISVRGNQLTTGTDGVFSVNDIYSDTYQVSVTKPGYVSDSKSVFVSPEKTSRADFSLTRLLPTATPSILSFDRESLELSLILENKQSEKLTYTSQTSKSWINVSPKTGTIEPSNQKIINVTIDPQTLAFGSYNETLIINVASSSLTIPIEFIYDQAPFISIIEPITDGLYTTGEIMPIQWTSNLNGKVIVELLKANSILLEIASGIENNEGGNYSWEIPDLTADAYILKISSIEFPEIYAKSGVFQVEAGPTKPIVTTGEISELTVNTIRIKGVIESIGSEASEVTQYGHVYSVSNESPTIADFKTNLGSTKDLGEYESIITELIAGESYYVRAYAINQKGVAYGDTKLITTLTGVPSIITAEPRSINQTSAVLGGEITSTNGLDLTEKGILWSSSSPVTLNSNVIQHGNTTTDSFELTLNNLTPGRLYYFKAYAKNSNGIGLGEQLNFSTTPGLPTVITKGSSDIKSNGFSASGEISYNGGSDLIHYGFVYSDQNQNPTSNDSELIVGNGEFQGEFSDEIINLLPQKTYYFRAFAMNNIGVNYGEVLEVSTLEGKYVNFSNPLFGEELDVNQIYSINWDSNYADRRVILELHIDDDLYQELDNDILLSSNSFEWVINSDTPASSNCFFRLIDYNTLDILGESNLFTTNKYLSIKSPYEGKKMIRSNIEIFWEINYSTTLEVELYKGSSFIKSLGLNIDSSNGGVTFSGNDLGIEPGSNYRIKVIDQNDSSISMLSDPFEIVNQVGTFIDERDGNEYKTVVIGDQLWMAEDLRYKGNNFKETFDGSITYRMEGNDFVWVNQDCDTYQYNDRDYENRCWGYVNVQPEYVPNGWRVPTEEDWRKLEYFLGMQEDELFRTDVRFDNGISYRSSGNVGRKLKSKEWNGEDLYGFNIIPRRSWNNGKKYTLYLTNETTIINNGISRILRYFDDNDGSVRAVTYASGNSYEITNYTPNITAAGASNFFYHVRLIKDE